METQIPSAPVAPAPPRHGWARGVLIGCGALALILLACVVGLFLYVRRNPAMLTDLMLRQVESHYGPEVTEQDKRELRSAYAEFRTALEQKRVDRTAVQRLQITFSSSRSDRLTRDQVQSITRAFRQAAGTSSSAAPGVPSPVPVSTPSS